MAEKYSTSDQMVMSLYHLGHKFTIHDELSESEIIALVQFDYEEQDAKSLIFELVENDFLIIIKNDSNDNDIKFKKTKNLGERAQYLLVNHENDFASDLLPDYDNDDYYLYRDHVLGSIKHSSDVFGPRLNPVKFSLHGFVDETRRDWTLRALRDLHILGMVDSINPPSQLSKVEFFAGLTERGELYFDSLSRVPTDRVWTEKVVPATDRLVTLNHNSVEYKEATNAIDGVITAIQGDNEYGAEASEEKEALVGILKAGRALLSALAVKESAVRAMLLPALEFVSDNFSKGVLAALGATAVAAVLRLLGAL